MRRRSVLAACVAALLVAPSAQAQDVYTTTTCRTADGRPASTSGWTQGGEAPLVKEDACRQGGALSVGPSNAVSGWSKATWTFTAPPSTRIAGYSLYRTVRPVAGPGWAWNWALFRDIDKEEPGRHVETCFAAAGCTGLGDGTITAASRVAETGVDLTALVAFVDCNPQNCPSGTGPDLIKIHRGEFVLRDVIDPVLSGTPSGDLIDTQQPLTGVRSVSFSASDQGGGVFQAILFADGAAVASTVIDPNGGNCVPPFKGAVPCKPSASGTLSFDTATLPDGTHSLQLAVTDPTGTNNASYGPVQVRTQNQIAECDPTRTSGSTPVIAGLKGTRRSTITRRSQRGTVTGRIAGVGPGVTVNLISRERRSGAPAIISATAVTAADGSFSLAIPAGPSRRLRAAWRINGTDRYLVCSKPLNILVPARP